MSMKIIERASISIKRNPIKFLITFITFILINTLLSTYLFVYLGVENTDLVLRKQLPSVAILSLDSDRLIEHFEEVGEWPNQGITPAIAREIGSLPYVKAFDYTVWGYNFFSNEIIGVGDEANASPSTTTRGTQFTLKGGQHSGVLDVEAEIIYLHQGRTFTAEEMTNHSNVAFISHELLVTNGLSIGSTIRLDYHISAEDFGIDPSLLADFNTSLSFDLEIIGTYKVIDNPKEPLANVVEYASALNLIYVPNRLIEELIALYLPLSPILDPVFYDELMDKESAEYILNYDDFIYLLYDPLELPSFKEAASVILPDFWIVEDLTSLYNEVYHALSMIGHYSDQLLIGIIAASVVMTVLMILIVTIERKKEIGIYLSLGERKIKIFTQHMLEILLTSIMAFIVAINFGFLLA